MSPYLPLLLLTYILSCSAFSCVADIRNHSNENIIVYATTTKPNFCSLLATNTCTYGNNILYLRNNKPVSLMNCTSSYENCTTSYNFSIVDSCSKLSDVDCVDSMQLKEKIMVDTLAFYSLVKCTITLRHAVVLNFFNTSNVVNRTSIHVNPQVGSSFDGNGEMDPFYLPNNDETIAQLGEGFKVMMMYNSLVRLTKFTRVGGIIFFRTPPNLSCYMIVDSLENDNLTVNYCINQLYFTVNCTKQGSCSTGDRCTNYVCYFIRRYGTKEEELPHLHLTGFAKNKKSYKN